MIGESSESPASERSAVTSDDDSQDDNADRQSAENRRAKEIGGRGGLDPTRYGDWEKNGRCVDLLTSLSRRGMFRKGSK